jgi:hypothetical protein
MNAYRLGITWITMIVSLIIDLFPSVAGASVPSTDLMRQLYQLCIIAFRKMKRTLLIVALPVCFSPITPGGAHGSTWIGIDFCGDLFNLLDVAFSLSRSHSSECSPSESGQFGSISTTFVCRPSTSCLTGLDPGDGLHTIRDKVWQGRVVHCSSCHINVRNLVRLLGGALCQTQ